MAGWQSISELEPWAEIKCSNITAAEQSLVNHQDPAREVAATTVGVIWLLSGPMCLGTTTLKMASTSRSI